LAYVEVRNFVSRSVEGEFETSLGCVLSLENASRETIYQQAFDDIVDKCSAPRRDFFCHFLFTMPNTVPPGKYKLRIQIVDRNGSATSDADIDLIVVAKEQSGAGYGKGPQPKAGNSSGVSEEPIRLEFSKGQKTKGMDQS
jgi:hypothetical protein